MSRLRLQGGSESMTQVHEETARCVSSVDVIYVGGEEAGSAGSHIYAPRWKRILDIVCVLAALPCWLILMMLIAFWIKIASPGPIFYRQERIGCRGKRFMILKFRSMRANVETRTHEDHLTRLIQANCPMNKLDAAGDPRLILGGRLLRAFGLDELPQIFNVLRGEMSLVGPRPCTPHEFQHYRDWQRARVNTLPGLTGAWQVGGKNRTTFEEMIRLDLSYVNNKSPWLDLQILAKTLPAIVSQFLDSRKRQRREDESTSRRVSMEEPVVEELLH